MRILSLKPGHDGAAAFVEDGELVFSVEAEKDSLPRHSGVGAELIEAALALSPAPPDVVALGGWRRHLPGHDTSIGAGYLGLEPGPLREGRLFGARTRFFTSSHERSHILGAAAMHPAAPLRDCVVLVWEGTLGAFYEWGDYGRRLVKHDVMTEPGARYSALFALADPTFPPARRYPRPEDAGKLMALAAYGSAADLTDGARSAVDWLLDHQPFYPFDKSAPGGTGLKNAGLDDPAVLAAATLMTRRVFERFHARAQALRLGGVPLVIAGGCGLNCEWNEAWRRSGLFDGVWIPPCPDDSGSAIGTAVDAQVSLGGSPKLEWDVFSGASFVDEFKPGAPWRATDLDAADVAARLASGEIVAWVQGRAEIGPRALGHRSLLASATRSESKIRLNRIKRREDYRPIAPCCLEEDLPLWFDAAAPDPYMLFFSRVLDDRLPAVTHVDGTARVQSVGARQNPDLHKLLIACREATSVGVLCNTSLNFPGRGFINRASDLFAFCNAEPVNTAVVNGTLWCRDGPRR